MKSVSAEKEPRQKSLMSFSRAQTMDPFLCSLLLRLENITGIKRNYIVWVILNTVEFGLVQKKCDHWSPVVRSLHRLPVKLRSQTCNSWFWDPACSQTCSYAATLLRSSGSGWLLAALQDWWTHVYHICSMLPGIIIKVGTFQTLNHIKIGYFSYFINFKPVFIFFLQLISFYI